MRILILLILFSSLTLTFLFSQPSDISAHYYFTTEHFLANQQSSEPVQFILNAQGPEFIFIKDVIDPATSKSSKEGRKAWAIEYDGDTYIHLFHSPYSRADGLFIKLDVVGRFCLAVMDEDFTAQHNKASPSTYGGGIAGVLMNYGDMWGGGFFDTTGAKKKIFITDTKELTLVIPYKGKNAPIELLTASTLKWLAGKEAYTGRKWDYTVEEIVALVEDLNQRQK